MTCDQCKPVLAEIRADMERGVWPRRLGYIVEFVSPQGHVTACQAIAVGCLLHTPDHNRPVSAVNVFCAGANYGGGYIVEQKLTVPVDRTCGIYFGPDARANLERLIA